MQTMKRMILALLLVSLLFTACGTAPQAPTTTAAPTAAPVESVPETVEPETEPPTTTAVPTTTEPPILYRNPLNGQPMDEPYTGRPVAIVINNLKGALPHCGVADADIIYEILAEGGITRCLAVFSDVSKAGDIGSIRSARTYFISLAKSYDAILMHHGDSTLARSQFNAGVIDHVDGGAPWFIRNQDRINSGYSFEHTLFTSGEKVMDCLQEKDFRLTSNADRDYGVTFDEEAAIDGETANVVTVKYSQGNKTTKFTYDAESGTYSMYQHNRDYVDGNTGDQVTFTNILVLYAKMIYTNDASGHVRHTLEGENNGYYICGGKMIPIRWTRTSENHPFRYELEDGTPLVLQPGRTFVNVVPTKSTVTPE
jgi:hypothetical protein